VAERRLIARFERELDDTWWVLHSVGLIRHQTKRWAEADFVLVGPIGIVVIEVKGGRVSRSNGIWTFTNRHGHADSSTEGPFDQAGSAAGALQEWLASRLKRDSGRRFQVGYAVAIPDCVLDVEGPDIEPVLLSDGRTTAVPLDRFLDRVGEHWHERWNRPGLLEPSEVARVVEALRPDFDSRPSLRSMLRQLDDDIVKYTEQQQDVIAGFDETERVLITGGAGTGKTMLAVAEARRLAGDGVQTLLICHNRPLRDELSRGVADQPSITVKTASQVMLDAVTAAGMNGALGPEDDDYWNRRLPAAAAQALELLQQPQFDALIVDEGQDLLRLNLCNVLDLVLQDGLDDGTWRWFMDPDQRLFGRPEPATVERLERARDAKYRLTVNCRNTAQIANLAAMLSDTEPPRSAPIEGAEVAVDHASDDEVAEAVDNALSSLLDRGYLPEEITILLRRPDEAGLLDRARRRKDVQLVDTSRQPGIRVETIARFKGLESPAVVLAGFDNFESQQDQLSAYVGVTRAKHDIHLVVPESAHPSYQRRVDTYARTMTRLITSGRT
jgi:hypothetical protein